MSKNSMLIIMGALTVVSLLLVLPFIPLRNSFPEKISYSFDKFSTTVGFNIGGKLKNGRQIVRSRQLDAFSLDVNTFSAKKNNFRNSNFDILNNNNTYAYSGYLKKETVDSKTEGSQGTGLSFSKSSNGARNNSQKVGAISTSVNKTNNTTPVGTKTLQSATKQTYGAGQGGTHPGFDPEAQIPSLPLGDGTATLLIFGIVFGMVKYKQSVL